MSWELVSQSDTYEFRDGADGVGVERREVRTVVRKETITAYTSSSEAGNLSGTLSFVWNGTTHAKSLSGGKKYYCNGDSINRLEIPGNGADRVQEWIYYGIWEPYAGFDPE